MALSTPLASLARAADASTPASTQLIDQLGRVCDRHGLPDLATRLIDLEAWVRGELREFETELALVNRGPRAVQRAALHLIDLGGKHLRPMCVALASKVGSGFTAPARQLAVAVELIHSATLLHDDVVDLADTRRGQPAARALYGNATSIFAGDWLLVDALRRIRAAGVEGLLDRMLAIIEEMILAESLQLERRGRTIGGPGDLADYFRVVEGKTAALFRWAMYAGGRAAGLSEDECRALEGFGRHLGVAFQAIDDLLDFTGDPATTGKASLADLREGKLTYPLIIALEREPSILPAVREIAAAPGDEAPPAALCARVVEAIQKSGGYDECRKLARGRTQEAVACLAALPASRARTALQTVAEATLAREQ